MSETKNGLDKQKQKKSYNVTPKLKHRQALIKVLESHGSVGEAMREVGYAEATAKNPKNLTDSKSWQQLLDEAGLSDPEISKILAEHGRDKKDKRAALTAIKLVMQSKGMLKHNIISDKTEAEGFIGLD